MREHIELDRIIRACVDFRAGRVLARSQRVFARFAVFSFIALFQVIVLFSLSLKVDEKNAAARATRRKWR